MAPKKPRLFEPADLGPRVDPKHARRRHLHLADEPSEQVRFNPDGAGLVPGTTDGPPSGLSSRTRPTRPAPLAATLEPSAAQWATSGSRFTTWSSAALGYLLDDVTREEVPGSPLQALSIQRPFDNYVFSDFY
jgi:hypothetical protein